MRAPTDIAGRRHRPARGRILLVLIAIAVFFVLVSLRGIAGFYTDYLWFESLGLSGVWSGVLGAKLFLVLAFSGALRNGVESDERPAFEDDRAARRWTR